MAMNDARSGSRFDRKQETKKQNKTLLPGADEAPLPPPVQPIRSEKKDVGRNDPCPCGSGKKYKKCCGK